MAEKPQADVIQRFLEQMVAALESGSVVVDSFHLGTFTFVYRGVSVAVCASFDPDYTASWYSLSLDGSVPPENVCSREFLEKIWKLANRLSNDRVAQREAARLADLRAKLEEIVGR